MTLFVLFLLNILLFVTDTNALYVDEGEPYDDGPLLDTIRRVELRRNETGIPIYTTVFYPDYTDDTVGLYFYLGGWGSTLPGDSYAETLTDVASHGFVVAAAWSLFSNGSSADPQTFLNLLDWLQDNLDQYVTSRIDWGAVGYGCHSAGCGQILPLTDLRPDIPQSLVFLEPFWLRFTEPSDLKIPAFMYGTELSDYSCSIPGFDYYRWYDQWTCSRFLHRIADVGHCAVLDQVWWEACRLVGACNVGTGENLARHRQYVQGVTAAMLMGTVQGQTARMLPYLTAASHIPENLIDLKADFSCEGKKL